MANSFIYSLTDSWTSSGTSYVGIGLDVTNTASAADSKLLSLAVDSTTVFSVGVSGNITSGSITSAGASFSDSVAVSGDPSISSEDSLEIRIDSDNNSTTQAFSVTKDTGYELLKVEETGQVTTPGKLHFNSDDTNLIFGTESTSAGGGNNIRFQNNGTYKAIVCQALLRVDYHMEVANATNVKDAGGAGTYYTFSTADNDNVTGPVMRFFKAIKWDPSVATNPAIFTTGSLDFRIDSNNDSTDKSFIISKGDGTSSGDTLLSVNESGELKFPSDVVKIGTSAADSNGTYQIGIGYAAGDDGGDYGIGIGFQAGQSAAGTDVIAIGRNAANDLNDSSRYVVAIGNYAGNIATADFGTMVGFYAGKGATGSANAVYIGSYAGRHTTGSAGNQISIGHESGYEADGDYNIALGYQSFKTGDGSNAIAIGKGALQDVTASYGIAIGENAGNNSSDQTISVGRCAGEDSGIGAVSVGYYAGYQSTGLENVLIGTEAGYQLDSSSTYNVLIGHESGKNLDGSTNVSIGRMAGHTYDGSESVLLGYFAGLNAVGENNIFLGANSGMSCVGSNNIELVTDGASTSILDDYSNKLHIENTIVGDTSAKKLAIGNVGSGDVVPDATLELKPNAASDVGLIIQGASSQSANLTEWQDSAEAVKASVDEDGVALFQKITLANLPTSDPGSAGQVWNDSGTLKISAG